MFLQKRCSTVGDTSAGAYFPQHFHPAENAIKSDIPGGSGGGGLPDRLVDIVA